LGIAGLARSAGRARSASESRRGPANAAPDRAARRRALGSTGIGVWAAIGLTVAIAGFNLTRQPPAVAFDGGWPAAELAAGRIVLAVGGRPIRLASLPTFKSTEAMAFPLLRLGRPAETLAANPAQPPGDGATVILCDALFTFAIGADCGGPAEDATVAGTGVSLADRFEAAPGRWVSIYLPG
ncbi:MAG TPA: hypothetical protein VK233_10935, partial [Candidatus Dormibacteraeota bacterium]|nr:hypothetical protein [Candidatus Dormibacteraeota bacterium]